VLAQEPDIILADEPIASLDPQSAESVMRTLQNIHATRGIPVIVNLHQVEVARAFSTRLVGLASGQVCLDAAPEEVSDHDVARLYAGTMLSEHGPRAMTAGQDVARQPPRVTSPAIGASA
jgi:phosphonate transport system ATP-binding protein